jgi:hypothetical protein
MRIQNLVSSIILVCIGHAAASGQSLADVAAAEAARRRAVTLPSKLYTNDSLSAESREGAAAATVPANPAPSSAAAGKPDAAAKTPPPDASKADPGKPDPAKKDETKTEQYWKSRMAAAQSSAARNKVLTDAMQSRINSLRADALNTHEPGQRAVVQANLDTAMGEMERLKQESEKHNKDLAAIQEEARRANVSPGWLR